jgi:hypothetical protein
VSERPSVEGGLLKSRALAKGFGGCYCTGRAPESRPKRGVAGSLAEEVDGGEVAEVGFQGY